MTPPSKAGRYLSFFILIGSLIACGGGGGGGSSDNPPTAGDNRDEATLETAAETALYGISFSEGLVELAQFSIKILINEQLKQTTSLASSDDVCSLGSTTVTLEDNDANYRLSAGDALLIETNACKSSILYGTATGHLQIDVEDYQLNTDGELSLSATIHYSSNFSIQDQDGDDINVEGSIALNYSLNDSETLHITGASNTALSVQQFEDVEIFNDFTITKLTDSTTSFPDRVSLSINIDIDSTLLNANVRCNGDDISFQRGIPYFISSNFACTGNFGEAELRDSNSIYIALPNEPQLTETYTFNPASVFDGAINSTALSSSSSLAYRFLSAVLPVDANYMDVDTAGDQVLIAVSSESAVAASSISSYTASEGLVERLSLGFNPGKITVSNDGEAFYVVAPRSGLHKYSLTTFSLLETIGITDDILDFALSPTDDSLIAVYTSAPNLSSGEVRLYRSTNLTDTFTESSFRDSFASLVFKPDGNQLLVSEGGPFFLLDINSDTFSIAKEYRYDAIGGRDGYISGSTLYYGNRGYSVNTLHKTGTFNQPGNSSFIDEPSGLAFLAGSYLYICDVSTYICFDEIVRQDTNSNTRDFYDATLANLQGQLLVANDSQINIYSIADFGNIGSANCNGQAVDDDNTNYVAYDCNIKALTYDSTRDKIYAITHGNTTQTITKSQILSIDPISNSITSIDIPLTPDVIEISSDNNTLYLYDYQAEEIQRYNVYDWSMLTPLAVVPEEGSFGRYEHIYDIRDLTASSTDPDLILVNRDYGLRANDFVGFDGNTPITSATHMLFRNSWADASGLFYRHGYTSSEAYQVNANVLSSLGITNNTSSCSFIAPLSAGYALSSCGETIDLSDGSASTGFDFSGYIDGTVAHNMTLDLNNDIAYVGFNHVPDNSHMTIASYDINSKRELRSLTLGFGYYVGTGSLATITDSGYLAILSDNGELYILPESELK